MTDFSKLKGIDLNTLFEAWHGLARREQDLERIDQREAGRRSGEGIFTLDELQRSAERVVLGDISLDDALLDDDEPDRTEATHTDSGPIPLSDA